MLKHSETSKEMIRRETPKEITHRMRELGYTMKEIATHLDCTERTVWNYVHNKSHRPTTIIPLPVVDITKMMRESTQRIINENKIKELEHYVNN